MKTYFELEKELLASRKSGDSLKKNLLMVVKGEVELNLSKTENQGRTKDEILLEVAKKMIKSCNQIGADNSKLEIEILTEFLPAQATKEEVVNFINSVKETESNVGKLTGLVMKQFSGRVEIKQVKQYIDESINS